jgi:hypothetical protein
MSSMRISKCYRLWKALPIGHGNTDGDAFPYIDGPVDLPYQDSLRFFHYGSEHILEVLNSELKALKR